MAGIRTIKIFDSVKEQEEYHFSNMLLTSAKERFIALLQMQELSKAFHKNTDSKRKIIIRHGYPQ